MRFLGSFGVGKSDLSLVTGRVQRHAESRSGLLNETAIGKVTYTVRRVRSRQGERVA